MAVHYRQKHLGETANLKFELIKTESNTVLRKIYEAFYICKEKPIIMINQKLRYYIGF